MRYWQALLPVAAAVAISPAAGAEPDIFIPVAYTESVVVVIQMNGDLPTTQLRKRGRASQVAYYATPSFNYEGVPVQRTETEYDVDCESRQIRRLRASAFREDGDRLGDESYSEAWTPVTPGTHTADIRRLVCEGVGPGDKIYTNLFAAVGAHGKLVRDTLASRLPGSQLPR
jgi:hypothetical protein